MLKDKHKIFADFYLSHFNATKAALDAGYTPSRAAVTAHELLAREDIQQYLSEQFTEMGKTVGITRERVMTEIGRLAFADIRKFYGVDGALKNIRDLDDDAAAALAGVECYEENLKTDDDAEKIVLGVTKKIKTYDKTKALEMLAKHFKIYTDAPINNNVITVGYGKEE